MAVASVVIVGAGLSGLVAAKECLASGIDVVVLEARERVGGRLKAQEREGAGTVDLGGQFTAPSLVQLHALAGELGLEWEPLPLIGALESGLASVRMFQGRRIVEQYPLASDPEAAEAYGEFVATIDALVERLVIDNPSLSPDASELDSMTITDWLDTNVHNDAARGAIGLDVVTIGDPSVVSMLYFVWYIAKFGGWEAHDNSSGGHFIGGAAQIPRLLAASLDDRIRLSTPVSSITHGPEGVVVRAGDQEFRADAVIVAVGGSVAASIDYLPALPPQHAVLVEGWIPQHGAKLLLDYDTAFWREDGLAGLATGEGVVGLVLDTTAGSSSGGTLCALSFLRFESTKFASDEDLAAAMLAEVAVLFGEKALEPRETHFANWEGDILSAGCSHALPTGVLLAAGAAVSTDTGRIIWAGSDRGTAEYMEGAVTAGLGAARRVTTLVN